MNIATLNDLKDYPQWVCFTPDKKPLNPHTGNGADCNKPDTWGNYNLARREWKTQKYAGIGFEFVKEQGITGVDLDHCIDENGIVSNYAQSIVTRLNSYAEYSPSGTGIHIWVKGNIPRNIGANKKLDGPYAIEMYDCERFFTITGKQVPGTPETFEERQEVLLSIHGEVLARRESERAQQKEQEKPTPQGSLFSSIDGDTPYGLKALEDECRNIATMLSGGRNTQLSTSAFIMGTLITAEDPRKRITRGTVERELRAAADQCGLLDEEPRTTEKSLQHNLDEGMRKPRKQNETPTTRAGSVPRCTPEPDVHFVLDCLHQGEWGDSLLFAHLFKGEVLYDHAEKEWYLWETHNWIIDTYGQVKHFVSGQLASVYIRAGATLNIQVSEQEAKAHNDDEEEQARAKDRLGKLKKQIGALTERAFLLRQVARNKNVLTFSATQPGMGITSKQWDTNPWLLAVPNGVVDLETGTLRDGKPTDYIRTVCPTEWQGIHAPAPRWEQFLQEIFEDRTDQERQEIIIFLQRIFGYGVTGEVREHVFLILYGEDGRNGKDTLQHAITRALGEVSAAISKDVLLATDKGKSSGAATPHLMDLQGKRLAWASEPEEGARFNIGQIKELSGGGDIPARGLFEKKITKIKPSHQLILLTNHKPQANSNDTAFWDRLRLVTFNMRYIDNPQEPNERKKDATLWGALEAESAGILAWLVRGCLDWQQNGLTMPQSVLKDAQDYRQGEDIIDMFLSECCFRKEGINTKSSKLYDAYVAWGKSSPHTYILNRMNFGLALKKKKLEKKDTRNGVFYQNIGLLTPDGDDSVNTSPELFTEDEPASQADLEDTATNGREHCEPLNSKVQKNVSRVGEKLELRGSGVHSVHSGMQGESIAPLVEPIEAGVDTLAECSQNGVNTSEGVHATPGMTSGIKKMLSDFKKKYEGKNQIFWTAPRTGIANGYIPPQEWYERFTKCYSSDDSVIREAAIEALKAKVQA